MNAGQYIGLAIIGVAALGLVVCWIRVNVEGQQRLRDMELAREMDRAWAEAFGRWLAEGDRRRGGSN